MFDIPIVNIYYLFILPKQAVRLSPQISRETKRVGETLTYRKDPISTTNHQWGMKERIAQEQ
ncbi:hypothetical protein DTX80_09490 [Bacilli bacterium]|nr:hypothetical protein DEJ64_15020 [Bacilli bacterium]PZD84577.1 hypothetical protein DEJ60_14310 [Bacilli bacterium]PZD86863.1 hypothetical protein DEJ66_14820 [Bacilli bacterium]RCO05854.1 hypothetical protein DTX80_09490 [Bacilli bacterium]RCO11229.1 hypothetical protein DTX79_00150 [Bacilli bacterium]